MILTFDDDIFLIYDLGENDKERFFIFYLKKISNFYTNGNIFADGTFDIAPDFFAQVYSIHALIDFKCYPIIYAFLYKNFNKKYVKIQCFF